MQNQCTSIVNEIDNLVLAMFLQFIERGIFSHRNRIANYIKKERLINNN